MQEYKILLSYMVDVLKFPTLVVWQKGIDIQRRPDQTQTASEEAV